MPYRSFNFFNRDQTKNSFSPMIYGYFDLKSFDFNNSGVDTLSSNRLDFFSNIDDFYLNDPSGTISYYSFTGEPSISTSVSKDNTPVFFGPPTTGDGKKLISLFNSGMLSGDLSGKFYNLLACGRADTFIFDNIDDSGNINKIYIYNTGSTFQNYSASLFAPNAPTISDITTSSFIASWNSVSGATNYRLDVAVNNSFTNFVSNYLNKNINGTSDIISGLNSGATYYVRVRSANSERISVSSPTRTVLMSASAPNIPNSSNITSSSFIASWNSVPGAVSYRLDVATDSSFTNFVENYQDKIINATNETVAGLNALTIYYIRVRAVNANEIASANSPTRTILTVLNAPNTPTISNITSSSFTANWNSVSGATSYRLDVATDSSFTNFVIGYQNKTINGNSYVVSGLRVDATYYIRIRAVGNTGTSNNSNFVGITTNINAPSQPNISNITSSSFIASWNSVSGATSYRLDVATNNSFTNFVSGYNDKVVNDTTDTISNLSSGTVYYIRIRAIISGNIISSNSSVQKILTIPSISSAPTISNITKNSFKVNWNTVIGAESYRLDVATNNSFTNFVSGYNDKNITLKTDTVFGLSSGSNYYVRIRAVNSGGVSVNSSTSTALTLPSQPVISASNIASNSFTISWNSISSATSYRIDVSNNSSFTNFIVGYNNKIVSGTTETVSGLISGAVYYVRVRAVNSTAASDNSLTLAIVTTTITTLNPIITNPINTSYTSNTSTTNSNAVLGHTDPNVLSAQSISWFSPTSGSATFYYSGVKHVLPYGRIKNSIIEHRTSGYLANNTTIAGFDNTEPYATAAISVKERAWTGLGNHPLDPVTGPIIINVDIEHQNHNDLLIALRSPGLPSSRAMPGGAGAGIQKILKYPTDFDAMDGMRMFAVSQEPCPTCWGPYTRWPHMHAEGNAEGVVILDERGRLRGPISARANQNVYIREPGYVSGDLEFWGEISLFSPIQAFTQNPNFLQQPTGQNLYIKNSYVANNRNLSYFTKNGVQYLGNKSITGEYVWWAEMRLPYGFSGSIFTGVRDLSSYIKFYLDDPTQTKSVNILNRVSFEELKNYPNIILQSGFMNIPGAPGGGAWFENIIFSGYKVTGFHGTRLTGIYIPFPNSPNSIIVGGWSFMLENYGFPSASLVTWPRNYKDLKDDNNKSLIDPYNGYYRISDNISGTRYAKIIQGEFRIKYSGDIGPNPNTIISGRKIHKFVLPNDFLGSSLRGNWKLMVLDHSSAMTGYLHGWDITFNNGVENRNWLNRSITIEPYVQK